MKKWPLFLLVILAGCLLASCQKELTYKNVGGGIVPPVVQKPKLGTEWTYYYYTFYSYGGVATISVLIHRAKTEETLGGEKWLRIVDVAADTTVYLLREKTDGLNQFANNSANLFCKNPAVVNDTYTSFNDRSNEVFTVKGVKDTLSTGIGDVPVNYYQGVKGTHLVDEIWYNENAWIVRRATYRQVGILNPNYYRNSIMYIGSIVY
jgi:hypothetical protein